MRKIIALIASLMAGTALTATAPALAQGWHEVHPAAPRMGPAAGGWHPGGPAFHPAPIHGAAPGHVLVAPRAGVGVRASVSVRPFAFQHREFAHFSPAERAEWQHGWWHHGWWHGRWGWWWFAGGYWWWYNAPVYPYPTVVSDTYYVEPTYDETGYGYWYYCQNPPGYYPYVQYCYGPWQPVPPTPPQGAEQSYDQGPPGYQGGPGDEQGPPPGYQGPSGYPDGQQGPPPDYQGETRGPPPEYDQDQYNQGPPPNSGQGPGYDGEQGPPPGD